MLRIELRNVTPGMKLAMRVQHPAQAGHTLLKAEYVLQMNSIVRLQELGVRDLWVAYPSLDFVREFVDEKILDAQQEVVDHICESFKTAQNRASARLPYEQYRQTVGQLIATLIENPQAAIFMDSLMHCGDDDLMRHSSSVTYLSLLMGLKLEGYLVKQRKHVTADRATEVINVGVGAMMHDVGIPELDDEVRRRYLATGDESDPQWQQHPCLGYEMVRGQIDATAATIVLNHHQRCDGSGYVGGTWPILDGLRIHIFARIAAVADEFDRTLHPVDGASPPTVYALWKLIRGDMLPRFDPQVLRALLAVAPPYPAGSIVRLSDDRWAVGVSHNVSDPCRPVVQIIPDPATLKADDLPPGEQVDLSESSPDQLSITHCDGHDVADLNFTIPDLRRKGYLEVALA